MAVHFKELNDHVTLADQVQTKKDGSVVLINVFTTDPADEDALLDAWTRGADIMKAQPGFISTQLHKGIADSPTFVNYAVWENVAAFRAAITNPEFQALNSQYPASAVTSPHLFEKLAVANHCVA